MGAREDERLLAEFDGLEHATRGELDAVALLPGAREHLEVVSEAMEDVIAAGDLLSMVAAYRHALQVVRHVRRVLAG